MGETKATVSPVIMIVGLKKTYLLGDVPIYALRGIDLRVDKGEFVSILGPSGSGKSTLLNMIGALDRPSEGKVYIDGIDLSTLNPNSLSQLRCRIGFVFQFFNLINRYTSLKNVELPLEIAGMSPAERHKRGRELLESVGLGERINHKPSELSGGERQRVAIARALANDPSFLLMDEPTGNTDSKTTEELMQLISWLNSEKGITIIIVTHDLNVASRTRRRVRMLDGRIVEEA